MFLTTVILPLIWAIPTTSSCLNFPAARVSSSSIFKFVSLCRSNKHPYLVAVKFAAFSDDL